MQTSETMLVAADRLAALIADENAALESHDWRRLPGLADDKRHATEAYEGALQALGDPRGLSPDARSRLGQAARRLAAVASENERRLTLVMAGQRRVMAVISEAVAATGSGVSTYGRSGGMSRGRATAAPLAISVDCAL